MIFGTVADLDFSSLNNSVDVSKSDLHDILRKAFR